MNIIHHTILLSVHLSTYPSIHLYFHHPNEEKFGAGGRRKEEELEDLAPGVMWISWGVSNE